MLSNPNSLIYFRLGTEIFFNHIFQIYKIKDLVKISYVKTDLESNNIVLNKTFELSSLENDVITILDIQNILNWLLTNLEDAKALKIISNELNIFKTKIEIKNGLITEDLDKLSPKLLMDKTFEEISTLINANKEEYFNLIRQQFEDTINLNYNLEDLGNSRVLKKE